MSASDWKRVVKPLVPVGLLEWTYRRHEASVQHAETLRRQRFAALTPVVAQTMAAIAALTPAQCRDATYLETTFIPTLGLNDEYLSEQPPQFAAAYGTGLHIWQYPNQLAAYLVWLADNVDGITSYLEIGCRWGGMFILISEWIRKHTTTLHAITALDLLEPTPFITTYFTLLDQQRTSGHPTPTATYLRHLSTSPEAKTAIDSLRPDFAFIDGDHRMQGVLADHMLVRPHAKIIAHHDIHSQSCRDTTALWTALKTLEAQTYDFHDFTAQYNTVPGHFLGIGAMKRKATA
jgi:hypothetical protein